MPRELTERLRKDLAESNTPSKRGHRDNGGGREQSRRHPEKSTTRGVAAEIKVSHQTVKRAREQMRDVGRDVTADVTPPPGAPRPTPRLPGAVFRCWSSTGTSRPHGRSQCCRWSMPRGRATPKSGGSVFADELRQDFASRLTAREFALGRRRRRR